MMALRRGFKTEANDIAREVRAELGLRSAAPLDPFELATHLEIPVIGMSELSGDARSAVNYFSIVDSSSFSAVTVFRGSLRVVIHNDTHSPGRQASNVCHETSHGLLLHSPTPAIDDRGCRDWDPQAEAEADWLCGALLVPDEAALNVVRRGLSISTAAQLYGVSNKMMKYRIGVTGARKRIQRMSGARSL